jgi:hypothetical protein
MQTILMEDNCKVTVLSWHAVECVERVERVERVALCVAKHEKGA